MWPEKTCRLYDDAWPSEENWQHMKTGKPAGAGKKVKPRPTPALRNQMRSVNRNR